jgi:hypothetical protein
MHQLYPAWPLFARVNFGDSPHIPHRGDCGGTNFPHTPSKAAERRLSSSLLPRAALEIPCLLSLLTFTGLDLSPEQEAQSRKLDLPEHSELGLQLFGKQRKYPTAAEKIGFFESKARSCTRPQKQERTSLAGKSGVRCQLGHSGGVGALGPRCLSPRWGERIGEGGRGRHGGMRGLRPLMRSQPKFAS